MQNENLTLTGADRITLYYRAGTSDKVYQASIEPAGDGLFNVSFAYGRRGAALQTGSKTSVPVSYEDARGIFERLVHEKTAKGYTPGEDGTPYLNNGTGKRDTGIACQLLNSITEPEAARFIASPDYAMQEKFDGRRLMIRCENGAVTGINRLGLETGVPDPVAREAAILGGDFIIDGEAVGDALHVFDVLRLNGVDLRSEPYSVRIVQVGALLFQHPLGSLRPVYTACTPAGKRDLLERLRFEGKEGAVFKELRAPYTPGRPASGGPQVKLKFYETATCIVTAPNARRSVSLGLLSDGRIVPCGNVTIPPDRNLPEAGELVEVRYLYAFPESHALYQPVYLGRRHDLSGEDCTPGQLKYKAA